MLINALVSTGELKEEESYDVDFDHQFLETEKYDDKPTYKKFLGYRPGVYVIGDKIVYIENSDGTRMCVFIRQTPIRDSSLFWNPRTSV